MAGSSDITAIKPSRNAITVFTTGAIEANDTGYAYLDVSTMDASKVIFIAERCTGAKAPTIVVVDGDEYVAGTVGNLTKATTASGEYIIGPLETARFKDSDGYIKIGKSTADTSVVYVRAILLP